MKKLFFSLLLLLITDLAISQGKKEPEGKRYPKMIKDDSKSKRGQESALFQKYFEMKTDDELLIKSSKNDKLGFVHEKYQQFYKKIKVEGAEYTVHSRNNIIEKLSGEFKGITSLDVSPSISASQALQFAIQHIGAKTYAWDVKVSKGYPDYKKPAGELVIIGGSEGEKFGPRLAWKFDIFASDPLYRAFIYVDAKSGEILTENHRIHNTNEPSTGNSLFNGTVSFTSDFTNASYRLRQTTSGNGIETYSLNNGTSYANATDVTSASTIFITDSAAVQAHWGAEKTFDYYKIKHTRNSYDNANAKIKSYVHYSTNYVNAFWNGSVMTYGDGNLSQGTRPLVSLDICGHEISHAVTENEANLTYSNESGALNESFSDIFGEAIENYAKGSNDWLMGCDIGVTSCGAFRSMSNPSLYGDPDTYRGTNWYAGTGDNGGVHTNSGVQNKWFYILVNGESNTNDFGNVYSVTGLGIDKAAQIAYRNLTVYLTASSGYISARDGAIASAIDLFGDGSPEVIATTNAWYAVGVGCKYNEICYCLSGGSSQTDEWISEVKIGSFTNTSTASPYTYFSGNTINLVAGTSYNISLKPGFTNLSYPEYWKIWIDYNNDNDFNDPGEQVYDAGATSTSTKTGALNILTTATGTSRMRVSMKYNAAPTPCEGFSYGEVEDYPVVFSAPVPDTIAPTLPVLSSPSKTQTSINISWTVATDNVGVIGYDVYVNNIKNNANNITGNTYVVNGLSAGTSYTIYVKAKDLANNSSSSNTLNITTQVTPPEILVKSYYFPTNLESWAPSSTTNCFWVNNATYAYEGNGSMLMQSKNIKSVSPTINMSGYSQVEVKFYFTAVGVEIGESLDLALSKNNGTSYTAITTLKSVTTASGINFKTDNGFYCATITMNSNSFTSTSKLRFQLNGSDATDKIYIDQITIKGRTGTTGSGNIVTLVPVVKAPAVIASIINGSVYNSLNHVDENAGIRLFPNPAKNQVTISSVESIQSIKLISSNGVPLKTIKESGKNTMVDISSLSPGIYIMEITTINRKTQMKFIKQ